MQDACNVSQPYTNIHRVEILSKHKLLMHRKGVRFEHTFYTVQNEKLNHKIARN